MSTPVSPSPPDAAPARGRATPQEPAPAPALEQEPQPPASRRPIRPVRLAVWVGSVVALGVIPVVLYVASRNYPINAKVGDCLTGDAITSTAAQDASDARIVSCTNPDARYKVVGKIDNRTKAQFIADPTMCGRYRGAGATSALWGQAIGGRNGFVLCLADNR